MIEILKPSAFPCDRTELLLNWTNYKLAENGGGRTDDTPWQNRIENHVFPYYRTSIKKLGKKGERTTQKWTTENIK